MHSTNGMYEAFEDKETGTLDDLGRQFFRCILDPWTRCFRVIFSFCSYSMQCWHIRAQQNEKKIAIPPLTDPESFRIFLKSYFLLLYFALIDYEDEIIVRLNPFFHTR